jgi:transglutaminase-like putative cysteine protease
VDRLTENGALTEHTYRVRHQTVYEYSSDVADGYSIVHLLPRATAHQDVIGSSVVSRPLADEFDERLDVFGNRVVQIGLHRPHSRFEVTALSTVRTRVAAIGDLGPPWELVAEDCATLSGPAAIEIGPMLARSGLVGVIDGTDALDALAASAFVAGRPIVDALRSLCHEVFTTFAFDPTATEVTTPLDDVLAHRGGVCQDFAHLAIAACRSRGLAARYVSGYIETDPPPGEQRTIGADASHAWLAVWVPDLGWIDFDPTNDQLPTSRHVTVAWGRDYGDVAPVRGVVIGPSATQSMQVSVDVART